ncbi:MAG: hypothetical protein AAF974_13575 [Cyanobacteria bacterium P01_E01_bin.34]
MPVCNSRFGDGMGWWRASDVDPPNRCGKDDCFLRDFERLRRERLMVLDHRMLWGSQEQMSCGSGGHTVTHPTETHGERQRIIAQPVCPV